MSGTVPDPVIAAPVETAAPAPEPVAAPVAEPVVAAPEPVAADPAPAAPVADPAKPTSLLSEPTAPDPNAPPEAPPEPLVYEPFTWPEGVEADAAELAPYTDILAAHRVPQEAAQELANLFMAEQQRANEAHAAAQAEAWEAARADWRDKFIADEQIGGNKQQTTLARCTEVIDRFAGTPEQAKELRDVLAFTGAGDHPATIRLLANIARAFSEGKPVPAAMARGVPSKSTPRSRYPSMNGAA